MDNGVKNSDSGHQLGVAFIDLRLPKEAVQSDTFNSKKIKSSFKIFFPKLI